MRVGIQALHNNGVMLSERVCEMSKHLYLGRAMSRQKDPW